VFKQQNQQHINQQNQQIILENKIIKKLQKTEKTNNKYQKQINTGSETMN